MLSLLFKLWARTPLPTLHFLGKLLGYILSLNMPKSKQRAIANLKQSQLVTDIPKATKQNFIHLGQSIMETPYIWFNDDAKVQPLLHAKHGWEAVKKATASQKGVIFLTPHLGCFEVISRQYSTLSPITVLYRPPKMAWLSTAMIEGRTGPDIALAKADASGVRALVKTLKKGGTIGILPDQVPAAGEGEWADFFGKPAYTMTLASKLASKTNATVFMVFSERLANGQGYDIHYTLVENVNTPQTLNQAIEQLVAQCPDQYNWHYHRYKSRRKSRGKLTQSD